MDQAAAIRSQLPPFSRLLGIQILVADRYRLVADLQIRDDLCTGHSAAHGGALMAFADTLGAMATVLNLPPGAGTTTLESKTNFFAPAPANSLVRGESIPLHRGRRTMVRQTRLTGEDGRLFAMVTQTQMVLEGGKKT